MILHGNQKIMQELKKPNLKYRKTQIAEAFRKLVRKTKTEHWEISSKCL